MKRIFTGLFNNWDIIADYRDVSIDKLNDSISQLIYEEADSESMIDENGYNFLKENISKSRTFIGGNGANAAISLSEAGIGTVMSCPCRTEKMLTELSRYKIKIAENGNIAKPLDCKRSGEDFGHISIERNSSRHLFTYDRISSEMILDYEFIHSLESAELLWLSGFHLVDGKFKSKVNELADYLEDRIFDIHLEIGKGTPVMKYALKYLADKNVITSLGFNGSEIDIFGIDPKTMMINDGLKDISKRLGIQKVTMHTKSSVSVYSEKMNSSYIDAARNAVKMAAAKSFGSISSNTLMMAEKLRANRIKEVFTKNFFTIPALYNPKPLRLTGLGDCFSVLDFYLSFS